MARQLPRHILIVIFKFKSNRNYHRLVNNSLSCLSTSKWDAFTSKH